MTPTSFERLYGRDEPPFELRWLRAGPLEVALDGADVRYVRLGKIELVRRVYVAVRDLNWDTIPEVQRHTSVEEFEGGFVVHSRVRHLRGPIEFSWEGRIEASSDGTIRYDMDGRCESEFQFAKIGICVHHPTRECAGRPYSATTPAGNIEGSLPLLVGPQIFDHDKGYELPLFDPFSDLSVELPDGVSVDFAFEGQLFEMEDQRNWTDASLKTASTPAYLGFVHQAVRGREMSQQLVIRVRVASPAVRAGARRVAGIERDVLTVGEPLGATLPPIGFGLPHDGQPHSEREAQRVRLLRPAHLRADLDAGDWESLTRALEAYETIGARLELALHVDGGTWDGADAVCQALSPASVARIFVFERGRETTPSATIAAARERLPSGVPIVGGTNIYFCDVNRDRPSVAALDGLAYSINSQVHAFDELSLVEALAGQADTVKSARAIFPGTPIVVSPVTLRPRFNPAAVTGELTADGPELPSAVDARQMSQFGAVWTLGSIKALSEAGASSLTYYETVGWRGLLERDAGNPRPELFPSTPGMLFPVYGLFSVLSGWAGAQLVDLAATDPLRLVGLGLRKGDESRLIIGNLTHKVMAVRVTGWDEASVLELGPYGIEVV